MREEESLFPREDTMGNSHRRLTATADGGGSQAVERAFYALHDACGDLEAAIRLVPTAQDAEDIQWRLGESIELLRSTARRAMQRADDLKAGVSDEYYAVALRLAGDPFAVWPPAVESRP